MNWSFQGTFQDTNTTLTNYTNVVATSGSMAFNGKSLTNVTFSNALNANTGAQTTQFFTDVKGSQEWTPVVDGSTTVAIDHFLFPLMVGKRCQQSIGNVSFADFNGDGITETGSIQIDTTVLAYENITVPAKTYVNAVKTQTTITIGVVASTTGQVISQTDLYTEWHAKDVGLVKQVYHAIATSNGVTMTEDATEVLAGRYSNLPFAANDLVYDPVSSKLYASISANAPTNANQVIAIDPVTGLSTGGVTILNHPGPLAVSDDGSRLYVGKIGASEVQSVNLPSMTVNPSFTLPNGTFGTVIVEDIKVVPGDSRSVAISLGYTASTPRHAGVAIYTNGVELLNKTPGHTGSNKIVFGNNASVLYGINTDSTENGFRVMNVDATGVSVISIAPGLTASSTIAGVIPSARDVVYAAGRSYLANGLIVDPVALVQTGSFLFTALPFSQSVATDVANNRVYFLGEAWPNFVVEAFDANTRVSTGSIAVPFNLPIPDTLKVMGNNGLAFLAHGTPSSATLFQSDWRIVLVHEGAGL